MSKRKIINHICNLDLYLGAIALGVLVAVTSCAVFMRYVLKSPLLWQEEVQAFCQVWMVFLGGSVAFRMGNIVAIEMIVDTLPDRAKKIVEYLIDAIVIFVLLFLAIQCHAYLEQVFQKSGRTTPILNIPYTTLYGIAPYGCVLMVLSYLANRFLPKGDDV